MNILKDFEIQGFNPRHPRQRNLYLNQQQIFYKKINFILNFYNFKLKQIIHRSMHSFNRDATNWLLSLENNVVENVLSISKIELL